LFRKDLIDHCILNSCSRLTSGLGGSVPSNIFL
jgi:hypothetical protein